MKKNAALWTIFFASGAAALGWQILWSKLFALSLGHEFGAVIAVVVCFFAGMALGAWLSSVRPLSLATLEVVIGAWGLLTPHLVSYSTSKWTVLLMLPATIAMGATLPAMRSLAQGQLARIYAANTFGGVLGCLFTAFAFLPQLDFVKVSWILAILNFSAAILAAWSSGPIQRNISTGAKCGRIFLVTGFLALGFETIGVRLLSQSLENTIYTFATILAVYLLGQALGAAIPRKPKPETLLFSLAVSVAASLWLFQWSGALYGLLRTQFGDSPAAVLFSELGVTLTVFGAPTVLMGALFVALVEKSGEQTISSALCWNSIGAGLGAVIVPAFFVGSIGSFWSITILAIGYLLPIRVWKPSVFIGAAATLLLISTGPRPLTLAHIASGQKLFAFKEGRMANVLVSESPDGNRTLFVNNRFQMGGTAARIPELRHAHIPLLLAREPKRALFIGLGTGISLSGAGAFPVEADGVELLPEVAEVIPLFVPTMPANVRVHVADARRFIRNTEHRYDVIVGDLFHPAQDGSGFLYTAEHFRRVKDRLTENGLFCQWLPLHQLDLQTWRTITRTFLSVFPNTDAYLLRPNIEAPVIGLIGWNGARPEMAESEFRNDESRRLGLTDSVRLYGNFVADAQALSKFAGAGELNRDFHPVVVYEAPRFSYQRHARLHERLMALLEALGPAHVSNPRIQKYIQARDIYLRALVTEYEGNQPRAIEGYLESARTSEDFTLGYAQCLTLASAWLKADAASAPARQLLERMVETQPRQRVAREMLERLKAP